MKIRPVEVEQFHVDGQMKLTVAFHNFANAPKNREYTQCRVSQMIDPLAPELFFFNFSTPYI